MGAGMGGENPYASMMGYAGSALGGLSGGVGAMPPGGPATAILGGGNTPYSHGYGMGSPGEFQGYQTGPGIQDPQGSNMQGGDLSQRGAGENMFALLGQNYTAPGKSERFATNTLGQYANGTPEVAGNQQDYFKSFTQSKPGIDKEPGFDAYYDRAAERLGRDMNNQMAARGVYGTSVGVGQLGDAMTDLRADQAKNEANYNLQRLGEQRAWEGLGGQLAGAADQNSQAQSQNRLGWLSGLNDIAQGSDQFGLNRLNAGMSAGNMAQGLEQSRAQQLFGNELAMGDRMSGMMGDTYGGMLAGDQDLMNSSMGMGMGLASEALNQDYRGQERIKDDAQWGMDMLSGFAGGMGGL